MTLHSLLRRPYTRHYSEFLFGSVATAYIGNSRRCFINCLIRSAYFLQQIHQLAFLNARESVRFCSSTLSCTLDLVFDIQLYSPRSNFPTRARQERVYTSNHSFFGDNLLTLGVLALSCSILQL